MKTTPTIRSHCFSLRSRFAAPAVVTALALAAMALPAISHAQSLVFSDPLTGPNSPNLTIPADYSYTAQGLQRTGNAVNRSLVKTVSGAHLTATQFTAEVAVNVALGDIAFVGLGQGVSNPNYGPNEPTNSFVFRIHNLGNYQQIDATVAAGLGANPFVTIGGIGTYANGSTTVFRIERDGDSVKLSVPSQNVSQTYSLAAHSAAMGLNLTNTHLFFGSGNTGTRFSSASVSVPVYASGLSPVIAWDPIFPSDSDASQALPTISYSDPRWTNPHPAFVFPIYSHPWEYEGWVPAGFKFGANWINAWPNLAANGAGGPGQSWTKYSTTVVGSGSYVLQFLADNASWIYIDGVLVGFQDYNWPTNGTGRYTIHLNGAGAHELSFVIWDAGGLAGGKFRLETTQSFLANNPGASLPPEPANVTLSNLVYTYDGTPKSATVATSPSGLTTSLTYNGSTAAPTAVGSYNVVATVTSPNYNGSATGTLVINKASATIVLGNLEHTYDGTVKAATATTTPAGLNVTFNTSGTLISAGSYGVSAAVTDANYTGSTTGTLVIGKATGTVTLGGLTQNYNGSPRTASATTNPAGLTVNFTYNGSATAPTAVGSYAVVATVNDANYAGTASGTLVISKGAATVTLGSLAQNYNGSPKPITATTSPTGLTVDFTYNGSAAAPTAVGSYAVVGTVNSPNYTGNASGTLIISKGLATIALGSLTHVYNNTDKSATATTTPAGLPVTFTYNGSATLPRNAGTYAVVATVNTASYVGTTTGTLTIAKATAGIALGSLAQTYNGAPKRATAATLPANLPVVFTYNGSTTPPINAGIYTVVATINHPNFAGTATGTLRVNKAAAAIRVATSTRTYTGLPHAGAATTTPAGLPVTFTYLSRNQQPIIAPKNVGKYHVIGTINHPNFTGSAKGSLTINPATVKVTLGSLAQTYDGTPRRATATTVPAGAPVTFRYNNSTSVPINAGSYGVTAIVNNPNYNPTTVRGTLVIAKATAIVTVSNFAQTFDGTLKTALGTTTPAGLPLRITTYNNSLIIPGRSAVGTYAVVATVIHTNYTGTGSGRLVISATGPKLSSLSPTFAFGGTSGVTLTVRGTGFNATSVVRFGNNSLTTTLVDSTTLTATVPANFLPIPAGGIYTLNVTVLNVAGDIVSRAKPFQIYAPAVGPRHTVSAEPGQTVTSQVAPQAGRPGVVATFNHSSLAGQGATLTTAVYTSNPAPTKRINLGGGIVDLQIVGADPEDSATVRFYYSSSVTGAAESSLIPRFWDGTKWVIIRSSGGRAPSRNTSNNLDGTVSGGRFIYVFDDTSTPKITELSGTIIGMAINEAPVAAAGPDQTVDTSESVTLDGSGSTDADEDEVLTYEWRKGREVLGDEAVLTTTLDVGVHTLTLEVTDESGETSTDTVVVTVSDTTPPMLVLPADFIRSTKNSDGRKVRYDVDVLDFGTAYRDIKLTYSHRSGSRFPLGDTTVTVTAKDEAGNVATGTFTITVTLRSDEDEDDGNGSCDDDDDDDRDHNHRGDRDKDDKEDSDGKKG